MSSVRRARALNVVGTALFCIIFYASSLSLTFYNKWMTQRLRFPLFVSLIHFIIVFLVTVHVRRCISYYKDHKFVVLEWSIYLKKVFPSAIATSLDISLSNWSIMLSTVSIYTMAKSTSIVFIMIFAVFLKLEKLSWNLVGVVFLISFGLFLFTYESDDFNLTGFLIALLASGLSGIRWTTIQLIMQKESIGLKNPLDTIYHLHPVMALSLVPLAAVIEGPRVASSSLLVAAHSTSVLFSSIGIIMTGACLAFALTVSEFLFISNTSGLALAIAGIFKEVCTLTIAHAEGEMEKLNAVGVLGLIICMSGISLHVVTKALKEPAKDTSHSSTEDSHFENVPMIKAYDSSEDDIIFDSSRR